MNALNITIVAGGGDTGWQTPTVTIIMYKIANNIGFQISYFIALTFSNQKKKVHYQLLCKIYDFENLNENTFIFQYTSLCH